MASTQVTPTRMELTRTKKKLVTAIKGHKLLKDKRDELMRQFLDLVKVNMELREKVEAGIRSANKNFVIAKAGMDEATLNTALMAPKQEVDLEVGQKNVMSVDIPVFETKTRTADANDIYSYGFAFTSSDLDGAVKSLADILPDMLKLAEEKGEDPFLIILDNIEDPHNLGAIIRTANLAGAHGVIVPKHRAVCLTATVAKTSAGALNYTPVAKVTNLVQTMEMLKEKGIWFVCADMNGQRMYDLDLKGPIGLVIGNEGEGVSRLVRENCDFTATIPMKGDIDSLNASVAAGVLAYEIVRQRSC